MSEFHRTHPRTESITDDLLHIATLDSDDVNWAYAAEAIREAAYKIRRHEVSLRDCAQISRFMQEDIKKLRTALREIAEKPTIDSYELQRVAREALGIKS